MGVVGGGGGGGGGRGEKKKKKKKKKREKKKKAEKKKTKKKQTQNNNNHPPNQPTKQRQIFLTYCFWNSSLIVDVYAAVLELGAKVYSSAIGTFFLKLFFSL